MQIPSVPIQLGYSWCLLVCSWRYVLVQDIILSDNSVTKYCTIQIIDYVQCLMGPWGIQRQCNCIYNMTKNTHDLYSKVDIKTLKATEAAEWNITFICFGFAIINGSCQKYQVGQPLVFRGEGQCSWFLKGCIEFDCFSKYLKWIKNLQFLDGGQVFFLDFRGGVNCIFIEHSLHLDHLGGLRTAQPKSYI